MKSRILTVCFAVMMMLGVQVMAQECATCSDANPCNACTTCCNQPCELFGGLKSLLACRPCAPCAAPAPVCAPCAAPAPVCAPCAAPAPVCAPCAAPAPVCAPCEAAPACGPCAAPACGPIFPCLKPALCNAGARVACVGNGARRVVSGLFGALSDMTAPCCCACGIPACDGGCSIGCGAAGCGFEAGGCSVCGAAAAVDAAPAQPVAAPEAELPESPTVAE